MGTGDATRLAVEALGTAVEARVACALRDVRLVEAAVELEPTATTPPTVQTAIRAAASVY